MLTLNASNECFWKLLTLGMIVHMYCVVIGGTEVGTGEMVIVTSTEVVVISLAQFDMKAVLHRQNGCAETGN